MTSTWKAPEAWEKDGSSITAVSSIRTGAWTSILLGQLTANGKTTEVIIRTFSIPETSADDPKKIAAEREKFLKTAHVQQFLNQSKAKAWVEMLKLSEDPANTSYTMKKLGPSIQGLLDHKVQLSARDLYNLVHSVLQGLIELFKLQQRSHGDIKPANILSAVASDPTPAYRLYDPAPDGEKHSANDLYNLGLILYQLIEGKAYDPLVRLTPSKNWARFGSRRDRWVQFLGLILNPAGCQEPLADVQREAFRLNPTSSLVPIVAGLAVVGLATCGVIGYHYATARQSATTNQPIAATPATTSSPGEKVDPVIKADYDQARQTYNDARARWSAQNRTRAYDHTRSIAAAREARNFSDQAVDQVNAGAWQPAADAYRKAAAKLDEAFTLAAAEEDAGKSQEQSAAHAKEEATKNFEAARQGYQQFKERWDQFERTHKELDLSAAKAMVDLAKSKLPEQIVLTDPASYAGAAELYQSAAQKLEAALAMAEKAKPLAKVPVTVTPSPPTTPVTPTAPEPVKVVTPPPAVVSSPPVDPATAIARADAALKNRNYPEAFANYKIAADAAGAGTGAPNASAMCNVGLFYETGQGVERDYTAAARYYRKASELNHVGAMCNLASLYQRGKGVDQDFAQAIALYKRAADLGNSDAMCSVGFLYERGEGAPQDYAEALRWYKKAAEMKNTAAINDVGIFYEKGRGVTADPAQAMAWYKKAAELNDPAGMNNIGMMYDKGVGVKIDVAQARAWYTKAAELNFAPAMCNLGTLYDNGQGVALDHREAFRWFKKSADLNHAMAMYNLGVLYENGRGVTKNTGDALTWYRKAAHASDPNAQQLALAALERLGFSP